MRDSDQRQWNDSSTVANNARITLGGDFRDGRILKRGVLDGSLNVRFPNGVTGDIGTAIIA